MKKMPLFVPLLWSVTAGIWFAHLCVDFYYGFTPDGLVVMHFFCTAASLAAAIINWNRYKKGKKK